MPRDGHRQDGHEWMQASRFESVNELLACALHRLQSALRLTALPVPLQGEQEHLPYARSRSQSKFADLAELASGAPPAHARRTMRHLLCALVIAAGCANNAHRQDSSGDGKSDASRQFSCSRFEDAVDDCVFEVVSSRGDEAPPVDEQVIDDAFDECVSDREWMSGVRDLACEPFADAPPRWCTMSIGQFLGKVFVPCLTEITKPTPEEFDVPK
jgi:hypothetical protein